MVSGAVPMTVGHNWYLVTVHGKNQNRYGFLRADNAMNVVSSADLVFHSGL